jgi:hypothetical protein
MVPVYRDPYLDIPWVATFDFLSWPTDTVPGQRMKQEEYAVLMEIGINDGGELNKSLLNVCGERLFGDVVC